MLEHLAHMDKQWFLEVVNCLRNPQMDILMPLIRDKYTWIPLYAVILFFIIKKYRLKSLYVLGFTGLAILLSDRISAGIIKPLVQRLRPCNDPCISGLFDPLIDCGSGFSFVSSHATNHFALAFFFISVLVTRSNRFAITSVFVFWAAIISFAQVYVGVHYPLDVATGALIGTIIGVGLGWVNQFVLAMRAGYTL